ncbi:MAG TPA: efflux transporter outer membrane subunit [Stellaceae bacterium]|nr:efflux transporter outer membrane subunit [Stellaceae bacterium]
MTLARWLLALAAMLALAGCKVGPDYVKPDTPITDNYKEPPPDADKDAGTWNTAVPADAMLRSTWWTMFGDKQLDGLEAQIDGANQTLRQAEAQFRQARAQLGYNLAAQMPTLSTAPGIESLRFSNNKPYFSNTRTTGDFTLPFDLNYEVDLWGRVARTITASGAEAQATAADLETARLSLHAELAIDYFELRATDAQQKLLDDTVQAYAEALRVTHNRVAGGAAPESDEAEAQTQLQTTQVQATDLAAQRAQFEHAIAVLIGKPPAAFSLPPAPLAIAPPVIPAGLPSELLERRPDIAAAERRVAEANEQIGIAKAAYYPSLIFDAQSGFEGHNFATWFNWPSLFWAVGLSMGETLFDGGRRRAASEQARAAYDGTVANYRQTTLTAFQEVEDNLATLRVLAREAQQQDAATASAKHSQELANNRYIGGRDTYLQVVTTQTLALQNERNAADIQRRRLDASVLLIKALGGGWKASDLPTIDALKKAGDSD